MPQICPHVLVKGMTQVIIASISDGDDPAAPNSAKHHPPHKIQSANGQQHAATFPCPFHTAPGETCYRTVCRKG